MKSLNAILKKRLSYETRRTLKTWRRRTVNFFCRKCKPISIDEMRVILVEKLGLGTGDKIFVASSFGNLNAAFTPDDLVVLLKEIVTPEGVIMMPYYPPGNSFEWAESGKVFNMDAMPSSMGVLTNRFALSPDTYKSNHPTKAVCVWGDRAKELVQGHELTETPFHYGSPYAYMIEHESKSVGLGLINIPIYHACEDLPSDINENYYLKQKFSLELINKGVKMIVPTLVHDPDQKFEEHAGVYINRVGLATYKRFNCGFSLVYSVSNQDLYEKTHEYLLKGHTRMA